VVSSDLRLAALLGVTGFLTLGFLSWKMPRYFRTAPEVCVQFGLLMLFALGTGVITAPGRLELVS